MSKHTETAGQYPVIPLRTEVQLPGHVGPLEIGREASVRAIEAATRDDNLIVIIPQKNPAVRDPGQRELLQLEVFQPQDVRTDLRKVVTAISVGCSHRPPCTPSSALSRRRSTRLE